MSKSSKETAINDNRFFDDCPSPMLVYDVQTLQIMAVNKAALRLYTYNEKEFLALTLGNIWYPADAVNMRQVVDKISKEEYYDSGRWRHLKKNGEIFYAHTYSNTTTFNGNHARMMLVVDESKYVEVEKQNNELQGNLEKQKKQYSQILSSLSVVVWQCRVDNYQLIYTNEACFNVFGYTADEMLADKDIFFNAIHPDDKEKFMASFAIMFAAGKVANDFRIIHKDGSTRYISSTATVNVAVDGAVETFSGSCVDITPQKFAEEALKEKAEETENILESITDAFIAMDENWDLTYVNRAAEKMYNVNRDELLHKNVWEAFPKTLNTRFYDEFLRAVREQVSVFIEGLSPTSGRWILASAFPARKGLVAYFKDYSEQKKLQEQISNNIQNLNALINNTSDLIWSVDKEYKIIFANLAFKEAVNKLNGITISARDSAMPKELGPLILKERKEQYDRALSGEAFMAIDERKIEGVLVYRETNFNPIKDDKGSVIGVSCMSRDVTERNKQLNKIKQQNEQLKEIAWIQSHKVRGPIATILGLAQLFDATAEG